MRLVCTKHLRNYSPHTYTGREVKSTTVYETGLRTKFLSAPCQNLVRSRDKQVIRFWAIKCAQALSSDNGCQAANNANSKYYMRKSTWFLQKYVAVKFTRNMWKRKKTHPQDVRKTRVINYSIEKFELQEDETAQTESETYSLLHFWRQNSSSNERFLWNNENLLDQEIVFPPYVHTSGQSTASCCHGDGISQTKH